MLDWLRQVESELGRRRLERWGPRAIDLDLLLYDRLILQTTHLVIPHPRMAFRRFVLEPACEVAAEMIHAPTGWSVEQLLKRLDSSPCYVAVCCADERRSRELAASAAPELPATLISVTSNSTRLTTYRTARSLAQPLRTALPRALESLAKQVSALATIATNERQKDCFLSDFWLKESLALASTWPAGPEQEQLQQACQAALERAPQPRFILHLDMTTAAPPRLVEFPVARSERPDSGNADSGNADPDNTAPQSHLEALAVQLRRQVSNTGQGPVVHIAASDREAALVELCAGIDAMR